MVLDPPFNFAYHTGMAYILSSDLIKWVATSSIPASMPKGHEDHLTAEWFIKAGWRDTLTHWISDGEFIDYPRNHGAWAARYTQHTRAVHQLKDRAAFVEAANWFITKKDRYKMDNELRKAKMEFPDENVFSQSVQSVNLFSSKSGLITSRRLGIANKRRR